MSVAFAVVTDDLLARSRQAMADVYMGAIRSGYVHAGTDIAGLIGRNLEAVGRTGGTALTAFNVATHHSYTAGEERQVETEWHRCTACGKLGEHPYPDPWAQGDSVVVLMRLFPKRPPNVFALDQAYLCQRQAETTWTIPARHRSGTLIAPCRTRVRVYWDPARPDPLRALVRLAEWSRRGG